MGTSALVLLGVLLCSSVFAGTGPAEASDLPLKAGESHVFDFGPEGVGGYPTVTFAGTEGPVRVRLAYATHPDGLGPKGDFWHETRANYMGPDLWLPILPASTDRFDVFEQTGAGTWRAPLAQGLVRYAKLTVEAGSATVKDVRFVNDGIHSEEPVVGSFSCSDERLNGVWRASVRTCQLAAIPARTTPLAVRGARTNAVLGTTYAYLSDGAKRDRLVWSGDLWFAQGNMYAAFASDSPYMPGSIRMLAENRTPDGYVQACPFPESHGPLKAGDYGPFASDEFAAWFVPVLCDHVLHTGDLGLAREMRGVVRDLVAYLDRHTGKDGIFEQRPETCKHSCGLAVGGTSLHHRAYMNILNWLAYCDAARLATWLGDAADANARASLAERTAQAVRREFWDAEAGHFRLSREEHKLGFEANALALAAKFATPAEAERILPQLTRNWHGKFQLLAIRGAFAYGQGEKALALVAAHNWYKYLEPEWKGLRTVQECCNLTTKGWGDEAHPDACLAGVLTEGILGVRPLEPGYRTFVVAPHPTASVTSAGGSVPTPTGPVKVSVRDGSCTVTGNGGTGTLRWNGRTAVVPPYGTVTLAAGRQPALETPRPGAYSVSILGDTHFDAEPASVYHGEFLRKYGKDAGQWWRPAEFARNAQMWAGPSRRILEASGRIAGKDTRFVLQLGDLIQGDCADAATHKRMLKECVDYMSAVYPKGLRFVTVCGNHDIRDGVDPMGNDQAAAESYRAYMGGRTTYGFREGPDLFVVMDFNRGREDAEEVKRLLRENEDVRYTFLVTHGGVFPFDVGTRRWFYLGAPEDDALRHEMRALFVRRNAIVLCGHTHHLEFKEAQFPEGRLVEFTMNTVYGGAKGKPNPAEPLVLREGPAAYGDTEWVRQSPEVTALFDEYRPHLRRYLAAKGVGHAVMRVSDAGVTFEYYGHDAVVPTRTWFVPNAKAHIFAPKPWKFQP